MKHSLIVLLLSLTLSADAAENDITLREYVDIRFEAQQEAVNAALAAADRAVSKAEAASEKRFESVNEFRAALSDQTRTMMPRAEAEQLIEAQNARIAELTTEMRAKAQDNATRIDTREARGEGTQDWWILLTMVVAVVASLYSIFVARTMRTVKSNSEGGS